MKFFYHRTIELYCEFIYVDDVYDHLLKGSAEKTVDILDIMLHLSAYLEISVRYVPLKSHKER